MKTNIKNFRKIISVVMITILTGSFALAQPSGGQQGPPQVPGEKQIKKMIGDLDKELDLTEEQNTQVSELYFAHFDQMEVLTESSQRPSREKMEALESTLEKEVKAVLTEDQQKQYTAWLKKQEKQRSSQRPQGGQRPAR